MFELRIKGERELYAAIDRLADAAGDVRETPEGWNPHVGLRLDYQRRHMDTEAAGGWTPLDDQYRLKKVEEVGSIPILQYTGQLYRSLTQKGAPNSVAEEGPQSLKVGTSDPKASYHHKGAGRLPKREVIVINEDEARQHAEAMERNYAELARAAGFTVI